MKKIIALLLAILSLFCFVSCKSPLKLTKMHLYGKEVNFKQACEWFNELSTKVNPTDEEVWCDLKITCNINDVETRSVSYSQFAYITNITTTKLNYEISGKFLISEDPTKIIGKMQIVMTQEYFYETKELKNNSSSSAEKIIVDAIFVNGWIYAKVKSTLLPSSWSPIDGYVYAQAKLLKDSKNEKLLKAQIFDETSLGNIYTAAYSFSIQALADTFSAENASKQGENVKFYVADNYLGTFTEGTKNDVYLRYGEYFEFNKKSGMIVSGAFELNTSYDLDGYDSYDARVNQTQEATIYAKYKQCKPIKITEPNNKSDYENQTIPGMDFFSF